MKGEFHTSFSPTIKHLKTTVSEEMRRNKHHTFFGTQTPKQRQTGRQTLARAQAVGPLAATHPLDSLLFSPTYPQHRWGCGHRHGTRQPHPRATSLARKPTKTRGKEGTEKRDFAYSCIFGRQLFQPGSSFPQRHSHHDLLGTHGTPVGTCAQEQ